MSGTILGGSGADALVGTAGTDLIFGFDLGAPANQVTAIDAARIASGLVQPLYATAPPDDPGRLFLVEKGGRILVMDLASASVSAAPTPFLDLSGQVSTQGEQGLLGLAFHPQYAANGRFYVQMSNTAGDSEIREYRVFANDPNRADPASGRLVLGFDQPDGSTDHKAGWLGFGPDGRLFVATGDGGNGDPFGSAQNPNTLLGKILRLDVEGDAFPADPARNYAIPADNPFASGGAGAGEVWAYGLRNPWRASFDRTTGEMWIADVGERRWEEIDLGVRGANYGWNRIEGPEPFAPGASVEGFTPPLFAYGRDAGGSVSGGYVYRGPEDGLHGLYLFADFVSGRVWSLARDPAGGAPAVVERTGQIAFDAGALNRPVSFGEDAEGRLYVVDFDGDVFRLTPRAAAADGADRLDGAGGDDRLYAGAGDDAVGGGAGADHIFGMGGADTLAGGPGPDRLWGGPGNDRLAGGPDADLLHGGDGADTAAFAGLRNAYGVATATGGVLTVADQRAAGGDGVDQVSAVEVLRFADGWLALDGRTDLGSALRLYRAALGRDPDPIGLGFWTGAFDAGTGTLADLARALVASPEFQARYGAPDNAGLVDLLYRNALGRAADAEGLAFWKGALDAGAVTRAEVAVGVSNSAEAVAATAGRFGGGMWAPDPVAVDVLRFYDVALGRLPDAGGLAAWIDLRNQGLAPPQMADAFVGSAEFQARYGALPNRGFVERLYLDGLDRPGGGEEIAHWSRVLDAGAASRAEVVSSFAFSDEMTAKLAPLVADGVAFL